MFGMLGNYFDQDDLKISFTFQSKYLGMSAWECPAAFTMVPFIEHEYGIYHVQGGLIFHTQKPPYTAQEFGYLLVREGVAQGQHRQGMLDLAKAGRWPRAKTLRGAIGQDQLGKPGLDRRVAKP